MQSKRKDPTKSSQTNSVSSPVRATEPGKPKSSPAKTKEPKLESVAAWLKTVKFKKRLLGGVDEADVWKKIGELNALYEAALDAEHARCDAMVDYYKQTCVTAVQKYKQAAVSARRERTGDE